MMSSAHKQDKPFLSEVDFVKSSQHGDLVQISGCGEGCSTDITQLLLKIPSFFTAPVIAIHPQTGINSDSDYISISIGLLDSCLGSLSL